MLKSDDQNHSRDPSPFKKSTLPLSRVSLCMSVLSNLVFIHEKSGGRWGHCPSQFFGFSAKF